MRAFIFLGPSLPLSVARRKLNAVYLPPARQGDILRLLNQQPEVIGIVDGVFESQPAIWHNEILFALSRGVRVAGAASMGALRAVELNGFGMTGIGSIYHAYVRGWLEDDDEVAVLHSPAELDWKPLTESKVNLRATLRSARRHGLISEYDEAELTHILSLIHYKELTMSNFEQRAKSAFRDFGFLFSWIRENKVDQKGKDAIALLNWVRERAAPLKVGQLSHYAPEPTTKWQTALAEVGMLSAVGSESGQREA